MTATEVENNERWQDAEDCQKCRKKNVIGFLSKTSVPWHMCKSCIDWAKSMFLKSKPIEIKSIEDLKSDRVMQVSEAFTKQITAHLDGLAASDPLFAVTYKKPGKNIKDCISYILGEVRKTGKNGFADEEIYGMAVHYYDEDNIKISSTGAAKVAVNHTKEAKAKQPSPAPIASKKVEKKGGKVYKSLFRLTMKPRTRLQVRVFALSKALPKLTDEQEHWAFQNGLNHWAYRTKTKTGCLDCGHVWPTANNALLIQILGNTSCECPNCGAQLKIKDTRKLKLHQRDFVGMVTVVEGFQLVRFFEIWSNHKVGQKPAMHICEVVQQWLQPDGKNEVVALNRGSMGSYSDNFHGDLQIRDRALMNYKYNIYPAKYFPKMKFLPVYKRNGFKGNFHGVTAFEMFTKLLTDSKFETLLKCRQYALLAARAGSDRRYDLDRYWDSIKICIRNNYKITNAVTWLDYAQLLSYFKKDLRSAKYVCPADLKAAHDKLVARKNEIDKHERYTSLLKSLRVDMNLYKNMSAAGLKAEYDRLMAIKNSEEKRKADELKKQKAAKEEAAYAEAKAAYFGLVFTDGKLTIQVLESVNDFFEEGDEHKHCVFTNEYYKKPNSLIFSARVNGKRVETIELDLQKMAIVQSRGINNKATPHHQKIIDLLNKNLGLIKKRKKAGKPASDIAA